MGKIDKLLARLLSLPYDLKYKELKTILASFNFFEDTKGKTSGSRVVFLHASDGTKIIGHRPHGDQPVSIAWIKQIVKFLKDRGDI